MPAGALYAAVVVLLLVLVIAAAAWRRGSPLARGLLLVPVALVGIGATLVLGGGGGGARGGEPVRGGAPRKAAAAAPGEEGPAALEAAALTKLSPALLAAAGEVAWKRQPLEAAPATLSAAVPRLAFESRPYGERGRTALHDHQRRQLLSVVGFLAGRVKPGDTVVIAGMPPGPAARHLATLYPDAKFEIYTRKTAGEAMPANVTVHPPFDSAAAREYAGKDVLFISNAGGKARRTANPAASLQEARAEQRSWVEAMDPRAALLQWRAQYGQAEPIEYLAGTLRFEPWGAPTSTDARLEVERPYTNASFEPKKIEEQALYINNVLREWAYYDADLAGATGRDHCYDCALETQIWTRHLGDAATPKKIAALFDETSVALGRSIRHGLHGTEVDKLPVEKRAQLLQSQPLRHAETAATEGAAEDDE